MNNYDLKESIGAVSLMQPDDSKVLISCVSSVTLKSTLVAVDDIKEFCRAIFNLYEDFQERDDVDSSVYMSDYFQVVGWFSVSSGRLSAFDSKDFVLIGSFEQIITNSTVYMPEV